MEHNSADGFTLIELSIVLVIIGLIVGGVLVGRDLIASAAIRAQIAQIDQFQQAVNTFRGKYGYLPGDIADPDASRFGFKPRGGNLPGQGNGDGIIQGLQGLATLPSGFAYLDGENGAFWVDLSTAKLIPYGFSLANPADVGIAVSGSALANYIPPAKIRAGSYVYVDSGGPYNGTGANSKNYFGLSGVSAIGTSAVWEIHSKPTLTVSEAYNFDKKIDDGKPQSGKIMSFYYNYDAANYPIFANGNNDSSTPFPGGAALSASATTCSDNGGNASADQAYSMLQNNGAGVNCALHFELN